MCRGGGFTLSPGRPLACDDAAMAQSTPPSSVPDTGRPPLRRPESGRVLAGVAVGLAEHLRVSVAWVRLGFVVLTLVSGFGALLYAGLWLAVPNQSRPEESIGQQAAHRLGMRSPEETRQDLHPGLLAALAVLGFGVVLLFDAIVGSALWPLVVVAIGAAIVWRQAETRDSASVALLARVVIGASLVALGLILVLAGRGEVDVLLDSLASLMILLAGVGIVVGPWLVRLYRELTEERRERIRAQERSDVAAHLHDSVLQTLAVIQRRSDEPNEVVRLARAQERDLRRWLYGDELGASEGLRQALQDASDWVEDTYGVSVDVVIVGDLSAATDWEPLLAALREGMVNAAKHSGAPSVSVFVEVSEDQVEGFVRDTGRGFDVDGVPPDRRGVKGSIIERVTRRGGTAEVVSAIGEGTEVRVVLPRQTS